VYSFFGQPEISDQSFSDKVTEGLLL